MSDTSVFPWLSNSIVFSRLSRSVNHRFGFDWETADRLLRHVERYLDDSASYDAWVEKHENEFEQWRRDNGQA